MCRHTKNYGVLRDRATGEVLRMAPNSDNNTALTSRGHGNDPRKTSSLLIDEFLDLLKEKQLSYSMPVLNMEELHRLGYAILPYAYI